MEAILPPYCYNQNPANFKIEGALVHYISAINVDKDNALDMQANWNLLHDLNVDRDKRIWYPNAAGYYRTYASAHSLIGRQGEHWILVPEQYKAYHVGASSWKGRGNCNSFMYGLELVGTYKSKFEEEQYHTTAVAIARLMSEYGFNEDMVAGHEQVAPGRKKDPGIATGNFDMDHLKDLILSERT